MINIFRPGKRKEAASDNSSEHGSGRPSKLAKLFRCLSIDTSAASVIDVGGRPRRSSCSGVTGECQQVRLGTRERRYFVGAEDFPGEPERHAPAEKWPTSFEGGKALTKPGVTANDGSDAPSFSSACPSQDACEQIGVSPPRDIVALLEEIEELTEKKAVTVSRFQASLADVDNLHANLKAARDKNSSVEERAAELGEEVESLQVHRNTLSVRCSRLEKDVKLKEMDLENAVKVRQDQKKLLDDRMKNLFDSQRMLQALREQKVLYGTEPNVTHKCLRDDLWGLHGMYGALNEETQRQSDDLAVLRERLSQDVKERGLLEVELAGCERRLEDEKQREALLYAELKDVAAETDRYRKQLEQRTKEAFDLQKWAKETEVENAKLEGGTSCADGAESLLRNQILPVLKSINDQIPVLERSMATLSTGAPPAIEFSPQPESLGREALCSQWGTVEDDVKSDECQINDGDAFQACQNTSVDSLFRNPSSSEVHPSQILKDPDPSSINDGETFESNASFGSKENLENRHGLHGAALGDDSMTDMNEISQTNNRGETKVSTAQ
ncbi:hypothetical protein BSKO_04083 [Bryopsis sp. KO-2023]|nr:hypothetical protein BSKO_04083 [Bryopsis sp. KO-2023]